jgi:hypothetical protein
MVEKWKVNGRILFGRRFSESNQTCEALKETKLGIVLQKLYQKGSRIPGSFQPNFNGWTSRSAQRW